LVSNGPFLQLPSPFCHPEGQPPLPYNDRFLFVIPRGNRPSLTTTLCFLSSRGATVPSLQRPFPFCHPEGQPSLPYNDRFLFVIPSGNRPFLTTTLSLLSSRAKRADLQCAIRVPRSYRHTTSAILTESSWKHQPPLVTPGFQEWSAEPQIPRLRSPGFPVEIGGVGELHAPILRRKAHTQPCPAQRGRKSGSG
jgi:hypothetical protein